MPHNFFNIWDDVLIFYTWYVGLRPIIYKKKIFSLKYIKKVTEVLIFLLNGIKTTHEMYFLTKFFFFNSKISSLWVSQHLVHTIVKHLAKKYENRQGITALWAFLKKFLFLYLCIIGLHMFATLYRPNWL
jgi:hypothetical protein